MALAALLAVATVVAAREMAMAGSRTPQRPVAEPNASRSGGEADLRGMAGPGGAAPWPAPWLSRELLLSCLAGFALQFGFGFLIWLLPLQATQAGFGSEYAGGLMGLLGGVAAAWMALGGRLSDRRGRFGPMAAGLALLAVGLVALAGAPPGGAGWVAGSILGSLAFGSGFGILFPASAALVADVTSPATRGAAFSLFYVVFSVGTLAAPAVGGWLVGSGPEPDGYAVSGAPYLLGAGVAAAVAAAALREATGPIGAAPRGKGVGR